MNDTVICSHCRFPILGDSRGLRHYGTHVAHQEDECARLFQAEIDRLRSAVDLGEKRIRVLEERLFALGAMEEAPCFACGYAGRGYFQPETHPCAARHHAAMERAECEA